MPASKKKTSRHAQDGAISLNGKASDRDQALDLALAQIEKAFGRGSIMKMSESRVHSVSSVSTGSIILDMALGVGGVPRGRIIEIFGAESSGKTTLASHIVAEAQRAGGTAAYIDAEHAMDPAYAALCGVDVDSLYISQPDSAEQALEITDYLVRSGALDVVVIDSVAALVPSAELEGEMGDTHIGLQARLMSQALRKLTGSVSRTNTVVIFINQLREKVGVFFGSPEVTPGGRALKFYSSVRLDMRRMESIKVGNDVTGNRVRVRVVKNKVAAPFKTAEIEILFNRGISREGALIDMGLELGILTKSGSFFSHGDIRMGQGREAARQYLINNAEAQAEIDAAIRASFETVTLTPEAVAEVAAPAATDDEPAEE
ncbi:MAG: recombinase RecA [Chloroflexi bacterium]|nr:recombinase RecA [Chloroflexota bacterium]